MYAKGEKHPCSKLTEAQIIEIRELWGNPDLCYTLRELAKMYGCSVNNIHKIVSGKTWKHLLA